MGLVTMTTKDEWMRAAMADDTIVVELLVRLKQAHAMTPLKHPPCTEALLPPLRWGIRQPRSRMPIRYEKKDDGDSARNSPTTPLSWSADDASPSGAADGYEESSFPSNQCSGSTRLNLKDDYNNESASLSSKRSRKRKTFAQLKEEETLLLEERRHLKKELTLVHANIEEQRLKNENLKSMKHDVKLHCDKSIICDTGDSIVDGDKQRGGCITDAFGEDHLSNNPSQVDMTVDKEDKHFTLPDLNMMPLEEDSC